MAARTRRGNITQDAFVRCRTYNHAWDEFFPIDLEAPWYGWRLSLRCVRCGTERHDNIAFGTGEMMGRRYIYPEDYQLHGEDKKDRTVFREELFESLRAQLETHNGLGGNSKKITPIKKASKKSA
jgi:hypothetical protein